jgi:hypothetical protein
MDFLAAARRRNWVLNADYAAGKYLSLQTRVQGSRYRQSNGPTRGYAIMQDVQVDTGKLKGQYPLCPLRHGRLRQPAVRLREGRAVRLFAAGLQRPGHPAVPAAAIPLGRHLDVWLRYARTQLRDSDTIRLGAERDQRAAQIGSKGAGENELLTPERF